MKQQGRLAYKRTTKIIDRLTYSPARHKNKKVRDMRAKLQARKPSIPTRVIKEEKLKFGSFNVNGLDIEVSWAVQQLLQNRGFDVSSPLYLTLIKNIILTRYLHSQKLLVELISPLG